MRVLLVTSQITYMPDNYFDLLKRLLLKNKMNLAGLVLLKNLDIKTMKSIIGLYFYGAKNVSTTLMRNIEELPQRKRETLFERAGLPVLTAKTMNSKAMISWVKKNKIDLIVNLRTRCIYKREILEAPSIGCINIHHGILPKYRGTLCDLYALSEGREAGFTIHVMNAKIDAGKILRSEAVARENPGPNPVFDYMDYLSQTEETEAEALNDVLAEINKLKGFPDGSPNISNKPVFTRNPSRKKIQEFLARGIRL